MANSDRDPATHVKAILYPATEGESMVLPAGAMGTMTVTANGMRWTPARRARRRNQTIDWAWPEIHQVRIVPVKTGPYSYLIEIRTNRGAWWISIGQLDEPTVRESIGAHIEVLDG